MGRRLGSVEIIEGENTSSYGRQSSPYDYMISPLKIELRGVRSEFETL